VKTKGIGIPVLAITVIILSIIVSVVVGVYLVSKPRGEKVPKPAEFEVSNLVFNPSEVGVSEPVTILVTVKNIGDLEGIYEVKLKIDGEIQETENVTLAGDETETVSFTIAKNEAGTYNVTVGGLSGSFLVKPQPWENASLRISLPFPREVNQTSYSQQTENYALAFNINPSGIDFFTDEDRNNYIVIYWNEKQTTKIVASIEAIIFREVNSDVIVSASPHPYPIAENLIPNEVKPCLEPTHLSRSDDPNITALAEEIASDLEDEAEIVDKTVLWVYQNIEWKCSREWLNENECEKYGYRYVGNGIFEPIDSAIVGAVWALKYRIGVCGDFADLAVALLRAQGIPARSVFGIIADSESPTPDESSAGHSWIQVYYPKIGWINYDPTGATIHLPNHIEFTVQANRTSGYGVATGDFTEQWYVVGLGNNRVKIKYTVTVSPEN